MKFNSSWTNQNGISIHYLDSVDFADSTLTPILICPGLSEIAEEYTELLQFLLPRRAIVLSFRGRGQSDTPNNGYGLTDHISDIEAVVEAIKIEKFHLFGYSRGVSYALGYARKYPQLLTSLIVQDYPCEHLAMPIDWPEDYIYNYLIPFHRLDNNIREVAVRGIQLESKHEVLTFPFEKSLLVIRGVLEGALLTEDKLTTYLDNFESITLVEFENSAHDIRGSEKDKLFNVIKQFVDDIG